MKSKSGVSAPPLTVSVKGAADLLGTGRDAIYSLIEAGKIRTIAVGRRNLVVYADLPRFVEENAKLGLDPAKVEKARAARNQIAEAPGA